MNPQKEISTINNNQFKALLACVTWPHVINYGSGILARLVGRDMWISAAISVFTTMLLLFAVVYIGSKFPGKTVLEYGQSLLGTLLGKFLGLLLFIYFITAATSSIIMYIHHLTDFLLPETPFLVVTILHVSVICYFVWQGPEVIGRISVLAFTLALVFYFLVFLASLPEINIERITPLVDSGIVPVTKSSLKVDTFIGIVPLIVAIIMPLVAEQDKAFRSAGIGLAIGGAFFIFYFLVELMVMGPQVVALMRIASMDFVRSIQITQYLHRFESFMVALWYWSILVQAGILTYCALYCFLRTTGIQKTNPGTILFLGSILIILTEYLGHDRVLFLNFREYIWQYLSLPFQFGLPIILLVALALSKFLQARLNP